MSADAIKVIETDRNCREDVVSEVNSAQRIQKLEQSTSKMTTEFSENLEEYQQWEISTEIQLRQMDKNLKEALMTIETQRCSLVDLQLQNEILSQKLNEGRTTQESIIQKVEEIWEFYNVVEQDTNKINERLATCEESREEMKQLQKLKSQEIEKLMVEFKNLQIKHEGSCEILKSKLKNEEQEKLQMASEYQEKSQYLENKIKENDVQLLDKDETIKNMLLELRSVQDKNEVLENEKERFKDTSENCQNIIDNQERKLQDKCTKIYELEAVIKEKDEHLQKNTDDLNNAAVVKQSLDLKIEQLENSLNKTIDDSREQLEKTNTMLTEKMSRIAILMEQQQKLENENDNLKLQKDSLVMEIATSNKHLKETQDFNDIAKKNCEVMKSQLQDAEVKNQELTNTCMQLKKLKDDLKMKEEIISQLNNNKEQLKQEVDTLIQSQELLKIEVETFKTEVANCNEKFNNLKNEYENIQKNYETEKIARQISSDELQLIQESRKILQLQLTSCQNQLASQETELQEVRMKNIQGDAQLNRMQERIKLCEAEIQNWKMKAEESDKMNLSTLQDNQAKLSRINKLEGKLHIAVALQKRAKAMKCDIIEKLQYINELEKQIKALNAKQGEHAAEKLNLCDNVNTLMEEVQNLKNKIKHLSNDTNDKICRLETTLNERNKKIFEMENEAKTRKESFEKLQQEYKQLVEKCETHKAEFFSTLSSYKMSNQRIVSDKEKEIASFRAQLEKAKEKHEVELRKTQRDLLTMQASLENTKLQVETEKSNKEEIEKLNADLQCQITVLKNELNHEKISLAELKRNITPADIVVNAGISPTHATANKSFSVTTPKSYKEIPGVLLKQISLSTESRKHVTFSKLPSSSESETSASDCMEISSIIPAQKIKGKVVSPCTISFRPATPTSQPNRLWLGKTSPNLKQTTALSEPKPIPRGQPVEFTPNAKKLKMDSKMPATPRKGTAKIFKITQGERKTFWSEKKKKSEENLKWFDLDGAFTFNSEG